MAAACLVCRTRQEDRDLYDFKLKCGNRWTSWSGLWFKSEVEDKEWECPSKMYVTGMEVKRGRREFARAELREWQMRWSGMRTPTVRFFGWSSRRGTSGVAGRMKV